MTFVAFTGGAGCGKTHQLMGSLTDRLQAKPLSKGQQILALTFMHGSRKRLDARLTTQNLTGAKFECTVIDRFAARILHRWRDLAQHNGLGPFADDDYDGRCAAAARLLANPLVRNWVVAAYPIILLDEAQDLKPERLALFQALEEVCELYVAADGFQCLDDALRDSDVMGWVTKDDRHKELKQVHRTDQSGLLEAARALREGDPCPLNGTGFKVYGHPKGPNMATFFAAMELTTNKWSSAAIITPTMKCPQVKTLIERLQKNSYGKHDQFGPFRVRMETGPEVLANNLFEQIAPPKDISYVDAVDVLQPHRDNSTAKRTAQLLKHRQRVRGDGSINRQEFLDLLIAQAVEASRFAPSREIGLQAMTVHGAKNREFDGVVAIWPFRISGEEEQRRRLLYNAVTRAKKWCAVVCLNAKQLKETPFT